MRAAVIGTGHVGTAIAKGLQRAKHEVRMGSRQPSETRAPRGIPVGPSRSTAEWAEAVILAVPYSAIQEAVRAMGPGALKGKTVVDVTNVISPSMDLAVGFTTSGGEELQKLVPEANVVKAFNTVFARHMSTGKLAGQPLTLHVAGDTPQAKEAVMRLGRDIGFEPVDAGPLKAARYLEPMGMHLISLGYGQKMGDGIGYRLVRE
ncbi:MAG TPA: NADPH-dependent F420 reductase [Thermoplasmata archaeon]|nr:NADPH-dependent F420 reductase [Thermoplasmata archaeon]